MILEAVAELYRRYGKELFEYLCWLTKDPHRAEDLLQETFIRAMGGLFRFEGRSSVRTWLFAIARNSYIDDLRKYKEISSIDDIPQPVAAFDLEAEIIGREVRRAIDSALNTLDERARKVITMRSEGFRFSEIAAALEISENSARVLGHRAMKKVKQILNKEGSYETPL